MEEQRRMLWGDLDQLYPKGLEDPWLKAVELVKVAEVLDDSLTLDVEEKEEQDLLYGSSAFRMASLVDLTVTWTPLAHCPKEFEVLPASSIPRIVFVIEAHYVMDILVKLYDMLSKSKVGSCPSMIAVSFSSLWQQPRLVEFPSFSEYEDNDSSLRRLQGDGEMEEATQDIQDSVVSRALWIGKEKLATHPGKLILIQNTNKNFPPDALEILHSILETHTVDICKLTTTDHSYIDIGTESLVGNSGGIIALVKNRRELYNVLKYRTGLRGSLAFSMHVKLVLPPTLSLQEMSGPGVRKLISFKAGREVEFSLLSVTDLDEYELHFHPQRIGKPPYEPNLELPLQCVISYYTVWGEEVHQKTIWRFMDDDVFIDGQLSLASQFSEQRKIAMQVKSREVNISSVVGQKIWEALTTLKVLVVCCTRDARMKMCLVLRKFAGVLRYFKIK